MKIMHSKMYKIINFSNSQVAKTKNNNKKLSNVRKRDQNEEFMMKNTQKLSEVMKRDQNEFIMKNNQISFEHRQKHRCSHKQEDWSI